MLRDISFFECPLNDISGTAEPNTLFLMICKTNWYQIALELRNTEMERKKNKQTKTPKILSVENVFHIIK